MKAKHHIKVRTLPETSPFEPKLKTLIIGDYFTKTQESVDEVVAKLVALDGLSVNQIDNSSLIKHAFKSDGILLPSSPIKVLFMKHFQDVRSKITKKIVES